MPFTLVSHQAPALPLKLAAPRWFDGTALALGTMAPDLVYAVHGTPLFAEGHDLAAQLWLCTPLAVALTWVVVRHVADVLAVHLPAGGVLHLHDYRLLGRPDRRRPGLRWLVRAAVSGLVGSLLHLAVDAFTHTNGWVVTKVPFLGTRLGALPDELSGRSVFAHDLLQVGGSIVGAVVTLALLAHIGRHRLLTQWHPPAPALRPTAASRRRLVRASIAGVVLGTIVALAITGIEDHHRIQDLIIRIVVGTGAGVTVGCAWARRAMTPPARDATAR